MVEMQNRTRVYCFNVQQTELKWTALCNMVLLEQNHGVLFQLAPLNYIHPPYGTSHTLHWFHAYECVHLAGNDYTATNPTFNRKTQQVQSHEPDETPSV